MAAATAWLRMARSVGQLPRAHLNKLESGIPSEGGIKIKPTGRTEAREGEDEDRNKPSVSLVRPIKSKPPRTTFHSGRESVQRLFGCVSRRSAEINLVGTKELFPISEKVRVALPSCRPSGRAPRRWTAMTAAAAAAAAGGT